MARKDERLKYALSFKGKGMENEELKEEIKLAILDGAVWADKTMIEKACKWLSKHFYDKDYEIRDDEGCWIDADLMITDFRKAMED